MAVQSITFSWDSQTSDATFRATGLGVANCFTGGGWVRQNDTGIINWTTVVRGGANTVAGWDLFRMNDSLSGSYPCYVKMEIGQGSQVGILLIYLTIGTGTDGAGTITGQIGSRITLGPSSGTSYTLSNSKCSSDTNRINFWWYSTTNGFHVFFAIERSHDSSGADTNEGIMTVMGSVGGGTHAQFIPYTGTIGVDRAYTAAVTPATGTGAYGTEVYIFPVRIWYKSETSPFLGFYTYFNADLTQYNPITTTCWDGASRSIYPSGLAYSPTIYGGSAVIAYRND
jgi:hypothetical protein